MNPDTTQNQITPGIIIGWFALATGISLFPAIITGYMMSQVLPQGGSTLLILSGPAALLLVAGGLGLLLRTYFGYYCIYLVTFFGGIGGFKNSLIPYIRKWINIGPGTEDLFLALNLLIVAILMWEHWGRIVNLPSTKRRMHIVACSAILLFGMAWVSVGFAMIHRESGQKQAASELPVVGSEFEQFQTLAGISYYSVETKIPRGISMIFSGHSNESAVRGLADLHHLHKMDQPEAHKKFFPLAKNWKLDLKEFPTEFASDDLYYVGRLNSMPKVLLEIVYSKTDGRFTSQVFGVLPR